MGAGLKFYRSFVYALMLHASVFAGFYFSHFETAKTITPKFVTVGFATETPTQEFTNQQLEATAAPQKTISNQQIIASSSNIAKGKKIPKTYLEHLQLSVQEASYISQPNLSEKIRGSAVLRISFRRDGSVINYSLVRKSGYKDLDIAATNAGKNLLLRNFPPAPKNFDSGQQIMTYDFPVSFNSTENI